MPSTRSTLIQWPSVSSFGPHKWEKNLHANKNFWHVKLITHLMIVESSVSRQAFVFDLKDPRLDCLLHCFWKISLQLNNLGMRYKLARWLIVMPFGRFLMGLAHLYRVTTGCTNLICKGGEDWPKWASYTSGHFMITSLPNALAMRCKLVRWLIVMQ